MILEIKEIHSYYGTSHILFGLSIEVNEREVVCLLGRNGAGKTTTIKSIIGLVPPESGSIKFKGEEMKGKPPYYIAQRGVGYVPDYRGIFPDLTVRENLIIVERGNQGKIWTIDRVYDLFPDLKELDTHMGGKLSGGQQQMLSVGRTLMTNPQLLLLDEPVEGLAPLIAKTLAGRFKLLKEKGDLAILLVEQNVKFAAALSNRAYVIEKGVIQYHGSMEELSKNEEVKRRYLTV